MIKGILLDFDGTVVNSEKSRYESSKMILQEYGFNLTQELWDEKYKSLSSKQLFEDVIKELNLDKNYEDLYSKAKTLRQKIEEKEGVEIIDGFLEFYKKCQKLHLRCIVCSGGTTKHVERILKQCGLNSIGLKGFGREKYDKRKPYPDAWIKGLKELNLNKDEVLLFDDAKTGIEAGFRAEIKACCAINYNEKDFINFEKIEEKFKMKLWKKFKNWRDVDIEVLLNLY